MASGIVVLGQALQKRGYTPSEHPRFGGVGGHGAGSHHYVREALDFGNLAPGNSPERLQQLYDELEAYAGAFNIVELFYRDQGIPSPVADHEDHLHVAIEGPPTEALLEWAKLDPDEAEFLRRAQGDTPLDFIADKGSKLAADVATGLVGLLFDAIGADGARILLYVVLVLGGAGLAYLGMARIVGLRGDTPAPAGAPA
jgi:hypothetical protein